jgi:hypothetical protein
MHFTLLSYRDILGENPVRIIQRGDYVHNFYTLDLIFCGYVYPKLRTALFSSQLSTLLLIIFFISEILIIIYRNIFFPKYTES